MTRAQPKTRRLRYLSILLLATVGLVGYYGPWVAHRAAGLVIIGLDLAEYVKFLPRAASGQVLVQREIFYLPLLAASATASLTASRRCLPGWLRWALALAAAPLALAMLPPAWSPELLRWGEFRLQVVAIFICLVLIPGIVVTRFLPDWLVLAPIAFLALLAAIGPAWGFLQVRDSIGHIYRHNIPLGWGFWLCSVGFLGEAFSATLGILLPDPENRARQ